MKKQIFAFIFMLFWVSSFAQVIDENFIKAHTYTDLAKALENPEDVYGLDLSEQGLTTFPMEILEFKNLRMLQIGNGYQAQNWNLIEDLPQELGQLKNLEYLGITRNHIKKLPKEIGKLQNLKVLYCSDNHLKKLPKEIGDLQNLEELFCTGNQLTKLPSEVGKLQNLRTLSCVQNQLKQLPSEIGNLHNLQRLSCGNNLFTTFPKELSQLQNLEILTAENSNLSKLEMDHTHKILPNCNIFF